MGRDRGLDVLRPVPSDLPPEAGDAGVQQDGPSADGDPAAPPLVTLVRTARGWSVVSPSGTAHADDLVEGLSLADLVAEEFGALVEPDRTARRSARGPGQGAESAEDSRVSALERTIAQLEHALAARVSTERAIGVLAERTGTSPRAAFEALRREARSSGRPVAELAREVVAGLEQHDAGTPAPDAAAPHSPALTVAALPRPTAVASGAHPAAGPPPAVAVGDGRS